MRHLILAFLMIMAVGVFTLAEGQDVRTDVAEGRLRNLSTVEVAPGGVDVRDGHFGAEVIYVLEGAGTLETDGRSQVALKVGTVVQLFPKHHHVLTNTSRTQTLKVVVVGFVEAGQPRLVLAKGGTRQQKEASQQSEGCQLTPNGDLSQQKTNEQESSVMKGLVF